MSWLPHDAATWGLFLAIVALVLMYPMNVVANLSSPWLRDQWAARSRTTLLNRQDALIEEQKRLQDVPTIGEDIDMVLLTLQRLGSSVGLATHLILSIMIVALLRAFKKELGDAAQLAGLGALTLNAYGFMRTRERILRYRRRGSPRIRDGQKIELEKIGSKLAKYEAST